MQYKAFISYSHAEDSRTAAALESALRRFAKPWHKLRALRVFRDKSTLALTHALWPSIEQALSESEYFVLLASPTAATSSWVQHEVEWWLRHRSTDKLFIVLTDGELQWSAVSNSFSRDAHAGVLPPALDGAFAEQPLWLDLRWARTEDDLTLANSRFHQAVAEIAAPLHGRAKDELVGDDVREYRRTRRLAWLAVAALVMLTVSSVVLAVLAEVRRRDAAAQRLEAERQAQIATEQSALAQRQARIALARQLVAQAEVARTSSAAERQLSALLAIEALRRFQALGLPSFEADLAVRRSLSLLPQKVTSWHAGWPVDAVAFSPDGRQLVAASRSLATSSWDVSSRARVSTTKPAAANLQSVALSPGGRFLAAGTPSGDAYMLDAATLGRPTPRVGLGDDEHTRAVAVSADGTFIAAAGRDNPNAALVVMHAATGDEVGRVPWSTDVAFSPSGRYLAAGGGLWQVTATDSGHALRATKLPVLKAFVVRGVAFSPDERYFARAISESNQRRVELWSLPGQTRLQELDYDFSAVGLAVSVDGLYVAIAGTYFVEVRHPATATAAIVQQGAPRAIAFSPTGPTLSIGDGEAITLWRMTSLAEPTRFRPPREVRGVGFSQDGSRLVTLSWVLGEPAGMGMHKHVWDLRTNREVAGGRQALEWGEHAFSADGGSLAVGGRGEVVVWDLSSGRERRRIPFSGIVARQVALSAEGRHVAVLTSDRLQILEVETTKEIATLECPPQSDEFIFEGTTPRIALGDRGWYLATAFRRRFVRDTGMQDTLPPFVRVWDVSAAKELFTAPLAEPVFGKPPEQISLSPDGRYLAIGLDEGHVGVYELDRPGQAPAQFDHGLVGFSADGRYLVTSGTDVESPTFRAYSAEDLRYFATGAAADVAHVWDVTNGREVARIRHDPGSRPLGISSGGDRLVVLGPDGSVSVSQVDSRSLVAEACRLLLRNLSSDEWRRFIGEERRERTCPNLPLE